MLVRGGRQCRLQLRYASGGIASSQGSASIKSRLAVVRMTGDPN